MTTISWPEASAFTLASAVKDAVAQFTAVGIDSARLDAEMLMSETLRVERGRLYMNPDRALDDAALARFRALIARRARGEPVSYITGRREFWSLDFVVAPAAPPPVLAFLARGGRGASRFHISPAGASSGRSTSLWRPRCSRRAPRPSCWWRQQWSLSQRNHRRGFSIWARAAARSPSRWQRKLSVRRSLPRIFPARPWRSPAQTRGGMAWKTEYPF